jgi:hypothetical protein
LNRKNQASNTAKNIHNSYQKGARPRIMSHKTNRIAP